MQKAPQQSNLTFLKSSVKKIMKARTDKFFLYQVFWGVNFLFNVGRFSFKSKYSGADWLDPIISGLHLLWFSRTLVDQKNFGHWIFWFEKLAMVPSRNLVLISVPSLARLVVASHNPPSRGAGRLQKTRRGRENTTGQEDILLVGFNFLGRFGINQS